MTPGPAPLAPRRVVLVCTGNTCRSALAEAAYITSECVLAGARVMFARPAEPVEGAA